jgi:putative tricarboxylic transport membrane protein
MTLNKKALFPLLILICSIFYLIEAIKLGQPVTAEGIRPSFVPLVLGTLSCLFSLILTIKAAGLAKVPPGDMKLASSAGESETDKPAVAPAILTMIAISIYIALFTVVGYVLSSMLFVFAITTIFSTRDKWLSKLATSAAIVAFGYIVFEQLFGVRLPTLWG